MKEEFLHFIFKNRLWDNNSLKLSDGTDFEIIDTGILNHDSGPDFFNAKIKTGDTIWVGNIEIHVNSSDWYKHKHNLDLSYDNIILHIVYNNDKPVKRSTGEPIPVWEISFPHYLYNRYSEFKNNLKHIPCEEFTELIDARDLKLYFKKFGFERLEAKAVIIEEMLKKFNNDWEKAFYVLLSRNFGFKVNSFAFEQMALSLDLEVIRKNSDNIFSIEALLFGQSGLNTKAVDMYSKSLQNEYKFFANKYSLNPLNPAIWKTGRLRPGNTPWIRIAQLAALLKSFQGLFSVITNNDDINEIYGYFKNDVSEYWEIHHNFGKLSENSKKLIGRTAFDLIMINTIIPFRVLYSKYYRKKEDYVPIRWLESLKPENNQITKLWGNIGITASSAFETQALIYLYNSYCSQKKCLYCYIGTEIFRLLQKQFND